MTNRSDFTDEEWQRLGRAPLLVGTAISLADVGGPVGAVKESSAAVRTLVEAARGDGFGGFVQAVAQDAAARAQRRESPFGGFAIDRRNPLPAVLDELRAVNALLLEKAAAEEVAEFREWLKAAAQRVALAAREGGFLGIGGELVSEREQRMLEQLGEIFA